MAAKQEQSSAVGASGSLQGESDADLLVIMSWRIGEPNAARDAGSVFYDRHIRYVYGVCRKAAQKYFLGSDCAKDLTAETFARVYERAGTFSSGGITDPDQLRLRARAWIGAIANNVVMDVLRGRQNAHQQQLSSDAWELRTEILQTGDSTDVILARRAIDEVLDDREREVIRVTFLYYKPEAKQQRLSNAENADLAQALQTTPDNLRKIRRNAMLKIKDYVMSHRAAATGGHRLNAEKQP